MHNIKLIRKDPSYFTKKFNERNKGVSKIPKIELFRTLINVFLIKLNHK